MEVSEIRERYGVTKKEAAIFAVLLDGMTHSKEDIRLKALKGQHVSYNLIPMHIYRMKRKLRSLSIAIDPIYRGDSFLGWKLVMPRAA